MSKAKSYSIEIEEGTLQTITVDYIDPSTGLPIDLTSYTAHFTAKVPGTLPIVLDKTNLNGGLVINPHAGEITIVFRTEDTLGAAWDQLEYNLTVDLGGATDKVMKGLVSIMR